MASEGRPPEDLQEAVAATLRRLRGEVGATGPRPAQRIEPQLSMPTPAPAPSPGPTAGVTDEPPSPAAEARFTGEPVVETPAPARRLEPDLLSPVSQTDIPPIPSSQGQGPTTYEPVEEVTEEEYVAPRRHWLRYVAAFAVLIAFAVLGWWGYRHFAGRAGNGQVPVVAADQTPEKVPPADQPATQTQSQQETVYNQTSPGSTAQQPEVLLPQPEAPATPPAPAASTTAPSTTSGNTASGTTVGSVPAPPPATGSTTTTGTTTGTTAGNSTGTLTETLLPAESTTSSSAPASGQSTTGQAATGQATTGQAGGTQTATAAPSAPAATDTQGATAADQAGTGAAAPAPANDAPTAAGNYRVQLAALKTEADAKGAWKRLAAKYPDILGPLALHLEKVDLGTKGIYYRVQAGPFTHKNAARDICTKLKPKGQPCLVKP
jgi:SPOR domain